MMAETLAMFSICWLYFQDKRLRANIKSLSMLLLVQIMLFVIYSYLRMESRVFFPALLISTIFALMNTTFRETVLPPVQTTHRLPFSIEVTYFGKLSLVFLVLFSVLLTQKRTFSQYEYSPQLTEFYYKYKKLKLYKPIIACNEFYSFLKFTPFDHPGKALPHQSLQINLGTSIRSPDSNQHIQDLGLRNDLVSSLIQNRALLACPSYMKELFTVYASEHFHKEIKWNEQPLLAGPYAAIWSTSG